MRGMKWVQYFVIRKLSKVRSCMRGPRRRPWASVESDSSSAGHFWTPQILLISEFMFLWASCEWSDVRFRGSYVCYVEF